METTAVIHRTHLGRARVLGAVCFVFGRIGSYVAVCPCLFAPCIILTSPETRPPHSMLMRRDRILLVDVAGAGATCL